MATWNVRTGCDTGQLEIICGELDRYNISLAFLTELRLTCQGQTEVNVPRTDNSYIIYYSGADTRVQGVGFALKKSLTKSVLSFEPISSRLAVLSLAGTIRTQMIVAYAPTEVSDSQTKDDFYESLQHVYSSLPATDFKLCGGDFNAQVGSANPGWPKVLGKCGLGSLNDNGTRLLSFASANKLFVAGTFFRHRDIHKLTWRSPRGHCTIIDHFLVQRRFASSIRDVRTMRGADCGSDHFLVRLLLNLRLRRATPPGPRTSMVDWVQLSSQGTKDRFALELSNRFSSLPLENDANLEADMIASSVLHCGMQVCSKRKRKKYKHWLSDKSLDLIAKRRMVMKDPVHYRQLNGEVKKSIKNDHKVHLSMIASNLEEAQQRHDYR